MQVTFPALMSSIPGDIIEPSYGYVQNTCVAQEGGSTSSLVPGRRLAGCHCTACVSPRARAPAPECAKCTGPAVPSWGPDLAQLGLQTLDWKEGTTRVLALKAPSPAQAGVDEWGSG